MRVGIRDAERLKVSRLPPHPSGLRPCPPTPSGLQPSPPDRGSRPSPPVGGRLLGRSNMEEFGALWDVWIHILGIGAECACWGAGGRKGRPYDGDEVSPRVARRVVAPYKSWNRPPSSGSSGHLPPEGKAFWGNPSFAPKREGFRAADSRPYREKSSGAGG